jgi:plasmid stability protein
MRTTFDLPDPLFRELKARAATHGLKMKDLVADLLGQGLRLVRSSEQAVSRSPLPVARKLTGRRLPAMTNAQVARVLDADDVKRIGHGRRR